MADTINNTGSINDITNLRFYTAKGYEIPMQKSYVLTWELIPGNFASSCLATDVVLWDLLPLGYVLELS